MSQRSNLRLRIHHVAFVVTSALPLGVRRRLMFLYLHRRVPHFRHPRTISEKINWRILHDRSSELSWTCDKLAMKDHAVRLAPGARTPRTLWAGTDVRELLAIDLPRRWVLKANHRSGLYHLADGQLHEAELRRITAGWLGAKQGKLMGEWAYTRARPLIIAEERLGQEEPPEDFKFYVYRGEVKYVEVHSSRTRDHTLRYYTTTWEPLDVRVKGYGLTPPQPPPVHLTEMVGIASDMGRPFDFMRIDLYDLPEGVYLGETSPYPGSGLEPYTPVEFDAELGSHWILASA